jgi:tRNA threonylcarbamoyladenosine biosynthesis protein TsaE
MNTIIENEAEMLALGAKLAQQVQAGAVIFLYGPLGAGKTTLARGFLQALGYQGRVKSPTYALLETYSFAQVTVYHFDFYRVKEAKELQFIGIEDYFRPDSICLIEWPENAAAMLPKPTLSCYLDYQDDKRQIKMSEEKS